MASAAPLGQVDVAVGANIEKLLKGFADAEAAAGRLDRALNGKVTKPSGAAGKASDELAAAQERLRRQLERARGSADDFGREIQEAGDKTKRSAADIDSATGGLSDGFKGLAASIVAAFGINEIKNFADAYTRFTNQLTVAGYEGDALADTQERLYETAQKYGVQLEATGVLFGRLSQAQTSLGASGDDLLKAVRGVSAAIQIQGGDAQSAEGALLQFSQAIGGAVIQAEEFNSINDGARPILVAVANGIERFGGSVSKLRDEVRDGKVTSTEFFQAFLRGSAALEAQAARSNLTIAASFTILNNAIGRYIGETDDSLSATERISAALQLLAQNIDTVVDALTVLAVLLIGRYAAGMAAAVAGQIALRAALAGTAGQMGIVGAAAFAMQARLAGATTTMGALGFAARGAGASLLAAFGGPVGAALIAFGGLLYYVNTRASALREETAALEAQLAESEGRLDQVNRALRAAGVSTDQLADVSRAARGDIDALARSYGAAAAAAYQLATQAHQARTQMALGAQARLVEANANVRRLEGEIADSRSSEARTGWRAGNPGGTSAQTVELERQLATQRRIAATERRVLLATIEAQRNNVDIRPPESPDTPITPPPADDDDSPARARRGAQGPSAAELARQFAREERALAAQEIRARMDLTQDAEARADLQRELLTLERADALENIDANENYTDAQKAALKAHVDAIYGRVDAESDGEDLVVSANTSLAARAIALEAGRQAEEDAAKVRDSTHQIELDLLEGQQESARNDSERRAIERRIIEAQKAYERQVLQAIIDSPTASQTDKDVARAGLDSIDRRYQGRTGALDRDVEDDMRRTAPEGSESAHEDALAAIEDEEAAKLAIIQEALEARIITEEEAARRRVEIETDADRQIREIEAARQSVLLQGAQSTFESLASIAEQMAGKHSAAYKVMFAVSKAFAIADSIVKIQVAIANALALPFPANIPAIAQVAALGAGIVSNIMAVTGSFQSGGWTGDGAVDQIAGVTHGKEFVVKAGPAGRHRKMLESINAGRDPGAALATRAAAGGLGSGSGRGADRPLNVKVQNFAPGVRHEVRPGLTRDDVIIIAREEAPRAVAGDLDRPNSKVRKSLARNTTARGTKR